MLALNLKVPTISGEERLELSENYWVADGAPETLVCPPSGKRIEARYDNGDLVSVAFDNVTWVEACAKWPRLERSGWEEFFPLTAVEVELVVGGTSVSLRSGEPIRLGGMTGNGLFAMSNGGPAIQLQLTPPLVRLADLVRPSEAHPGYVTLKGANFYGVDLLGPAIIAVAPDSTDPPTMELINTTVITATGRPGDQYLVVPDGTSLPSGVVIVDAFRAERCRLANISFVVNRPFYDLLVESEERDRRERFEREDAAPTDD